MPLCRPRSTTGGHIIWSEVFSNEYLVIQRHPFGFKGLWWGQPYRILLKVNNWLVAEAETWADIDRDWEIAVKLVEQEFKIKERPRIFDQSRLLALFTAYHSNPELFELDSNASSSGQPQALETSAPDRLLVLSEDAFAPSQKPATAPVTTPETLASPASASAEPGVAAATASPAAAGPEPSLAAGSDSGDSTDASKPRPPLSPALSPADPDGDFRAVRQMQLINELKQLHARLRGDPWPPASHSATVDAAAAATGPGDSAAPSVDDDRAASVSTGDNELSASVLSGEPQGRQDTNHPTSADTLNGVQPAPSLSTQVVDQDHHDEGTDHAATRDESRHDASSEDRHDASDHVHLNDVHLGFDPGLEKAERMRGYIIKELLDTETTYVADLKLVIELYWSPLKPYPPANGSEGEHATEVDLAGLLIWRRTTGRAIPPDAFEAGYDPYGSKVYVARVAVGHEVQLGKAGRHLPGGMVYSYGGSERTAQGPYEVLCGITGLYKLEWRPWNISIGAPEGSLEAGHERSGPQYIARAKNFCDHSNVAVPGKAAPRFGGINLPLDGKEWHITDQAKYELLIARKRSHNGERPLSLAFESRNPNVLDSLDDYRSLEALFQCLGQVLKVNTFLHQTLESAVKYAAVQPDIGAVFLKVGQFLRVYNEYCAKSQQFFDAAKRLGATSPKFAAFCKKNAGDPRCRKLELMDFLIKPVQRISKYPMILRELLSNTPPTTIEHDNLVKAIALVSSVATEVNERKRLQDNSAKLIALNNMFEWSPGLVTENGQQWTLLTPGLPVDRRDSVASQAPLQSSTIVQMAQRVLLQKSDWDNGRQIAMLFNDVLVVGQWSMFSPRWVAPNVFSLRHCAVNETLDDPNCFVVGERQRSARIVTSSADAKRAWLRDISRSSKAIKLLVVGAPRVGKTTLVRKFLFKEQFDQRVPTFGDKYQCSLATRNESEADNSSNNAVQLYIHDTTGDGPRDLGYADVDVVLLCFSARQRPSLTLAVTTFLAAKMKYCSDAKAVLARLKADNSIDESAPNEPVDASVTSDEAASQAKTLGLGYASVSCFDEETVRKAFSVAVSLVLHGSAVVSMYDAKNAVQVVDV